ncbi:LysR family transcriptional regulator [Modestobacter excelsi]|uniref:LysR family transcriptional regulator n=1 Tax=Modestobacter excelsi TaxID=2213161 RepID=UPI001C20D053|nr:LysR family transcriptional regulator [Modestobacter excelsi]
MDLRGIDLNLLLALDALLNERNVTRAAQRLSIGQSAMSASLARLRRHFDDRLLVLEGKALLPTPMAEALQPLVREAVRAVHTVFDRPRGFDASVDRRSFTVLASDYATLILLRPLIARLAQEAPLQRINVRPIQMDYVGQVRDGDADLFILPAELADPRLPYPHRHLFTDRYVLVADAGNKAVGAAVTREQFSDLPYIAFDAGPHPSFADSQLEALDVARRVEMTTQSLVIMPLLVVGTPLVALAHERLVLHLTDQVALKVVEPPVPLRPLRETLFWHARQTEDPGHLWLREQITEQATQLDVDAVPH